MASQLSSEREQIIHSLMQRGRYASADEVIDEALRLLKHQDDVEQARVLEGIRQGIEDMNAGRHRLADELFAEIRHEFNIPPDA